MRRKVKKVIIIIVIFFLFICSSCDTKINSTIYISSIGMEMKDDKVIVHFLSNPLTDISRNESKEGNKESEVLKIEASSVYEAFNNASLSLLSPLNFRHIKTVIFHNSVVETRFIEEFLQYIKSVRYISYNFYVFATNSDIKEIYNFKNPEQISYQYSLLSSPDLVDYSNFGVNRLHFLDFVNSFLIDSRFLHIPAIVASKSWSENITLEIDGFLCLDENSNYYSNKEFSGMLYLNNKNTIIFKDGDDIYRITDYKVITKVIDNTFTILISYKNILSYSGGDKENFERKLALEIKKYLDTYIEKQGKLYLVEFYNYLNNTNVLTDVYNLEILYKG